MATSQTAYINNTQPAPLTGTSSWLNGTTAWAALGAVFLTTMAYVLLQWVTSPYFAPAPVGDAVIPEGELMFVRAVEYTSASLALIVTWFVLIKPIIKTGEISWDGMILILFAGLLWYDVLDNYINTSFWYNAYLTNMGSWGGFIPGWSYPNQGYFPEPFLLMGGLYIWFFMGPAILGGKFLNFMKRRFPNNGMALNIFCLFLGLAMFDAIVEIFFVRTGTFAYPGAIRSLSLWPGEPYQFPLYEPIIVGGMLTTYACLRYFRDDKGFTFVERGVEQMKLPKARETFVRFLALAGVTYSIIITTY